MRIPRAVPLLAPEVQFFDVNQNYPSVNTGFAVPLSSIAQGDGAQQRDGVVLHPVALEIRGFLGVGLAPDKVRVVIGRLLYDQASFNISQIFEYPAAGVGVNSPYTIEYQGQSAADRRVEILYDRVFELSTDWHAIQSWSVHLPLQGAKHNLIRYLTANGTNVPVMGGLFLCTVSVAALGDAPTVGFCSRLHFLDA